MSRWLSIVGLGEGGWPELSALGRSLVEGAELVVGGERHLAMLPATIRGERLSWVVPLTQTLEEIQRHRGRPVAVLATGDPMHFGIGVTLARAVPMSETLVLPAVSAFSLAAARLGWPIAECECLTLHGRPLARFAGFLYPGARLLLLSHDGTTPAQIAAELVRRGFGSSRLILLEQMGGRQGANPRSDGRDMDVGADGRSQHSGRRMRRRSRRPSLPRLPGLPDDAFRHDGQLTKREIRAATLAALAPLPGQRLWDIGAGCGIHRDRMAACRAGYEGDRCRERCQAPGVHRREFERAGHAGDRDHCRGGTTGAGGPRIPRMPSSSVAGSPPRAWSSAAGVHFPPAAGSSPMS